MYEALAALKPAKADDASGAEVTEIAVCLAVDAKDPVILAYEARAVRKRGRRMAKRGARLTASASAAVTALLDEALLGNASLGKAGATAVVVCVGRLETGTDGRKDYRNAFQFAARYKLPILFVVANTWTRGQRQALDLRTLHAEFGIPVFSVDAGDAIAAYRVATEALHNARHGRGPCIIEALTVDGKGNDPASARELLTVYMERHGNRPR
jgi:TPP-dependent pyruvate/acetoin dehydrogenase alpha subunit